MSETNKKTDNNASQNDAVFGGIVALSVKTLFYLFIILSLLAGTFCQLFPYKAAKFYYDLEDYQTALVYAKKSAKRSNNTDALILGVEMSEILVYSYDLAIANDNNEKSTKKALKNLESAAEYLLFFTDNLANHNDFERTCDYYDDYYLSSAQTLTAQIGLYSFKVYVCSMNTIARSVLKKTDTLLYPASTLGFVTAQEGYITPAELTELFLQLVDGDIIPQSFESLSALALILNQLSQNILWGSGDLVFDGSVTLLYDFVKEIINGEGFSFIGASLEINSPLERLFLLDSVATLCDRVLWLFDTLDNETEKQRATEAFSFIYNGESVLISDYYDNFLRAFQLVNA